MPSAVELVSESNQFRERYTTDSSGILIAKRLPFGTYRVGVTRDGFATFSGVVDDAVAQRPEFTDLLAIQPGVIPVTTMQSDSIIMAGVTGAVQPSGLAVINRIPSGGPTR